MIKKSFPIKHLPYRRRRGNGRNRSHGRNGRDRSHRRDGCNGNDACGAGLERLHDSFHPYYLRFRH